MKINDNKVVALSYVLDVEGAVRDRADAEHPLEFIFGMGYLLPKFEANVLDKEVGDTFDFVLTPEEGYGVYSASAVLDLARSMFESDGKIDERIRVGATVPMMTNDGRVVPGRVLEINDEKVKMDFNHELAGKTLHFTGEVLAVREATDKELAEGLHGELAHHCSGNCSDCEGGCGK
ncbi:MAG: peptidylprolyl isomerase [Bacteroidales bacterium]|nr:peptidylprolyl isomerase [Bacteroidales bacterium]